MRKVPCLNYIVIIVFLILFLLLILLYYTAAWQEWGPTAHLVFSQLQRVSL